MTITVNARTYHDADACRDYAVEHGYTVEKLTLNLHGKTVWAKGENKIICNKKNMKNEWD